MLFTAYCVDKQDHLPVRMETRSAHLDFLKAKGTELKVAGPTTAADGETPNGSLLIFEANTLIDAKNWVAMDPYADAGLFESVDVKPWKHAIGAGL